MVIRETEQMSKENHKCTTQAAAATTSAPKGSISIQSTGNVPGMNGSYIVVDKNGKMVVAGESKWLHLQLLW